jgi:enoyl-[acyl-carrier protein] reductase I
VGPLPLARGLDVGKGDRPGRHRISFRSGALPGGPEADGIVQTTSGGIMLLDGKRGLILGIANKRSIAWGIAQAAHREGARLAVTYQGERLEENVRELAQQLRDPLILPCDVSKDDDLKALAASVREGLGGIDFVVHAVAFALREELDGEFLNTSREGYRLAQDISSYSLTALARETAPLMEGGGSIVTLSYLGGERVVPHYNVMGVAKAALEMSVRYLAADLGPKGIRVNAISAGPIKTLAASGVHGLSKMLEYHRTHAPLRKTTDQEEVGDTALFLVSHLSRGVTGEVIHVDGGFHVMGMAAL